MISLTLPQVHPCTHPEGKVCIQFPIVDLRNQANCLPKRLKPAPETEEEMMVEIFNYTERVVNMVRPRKLLFMAIGELVRRVLYGRQLTSPRWCCPPG